MEHTLDFDRGLEAVFGLELGQQASFRTIGDRLVMKEPLRQMGLIIISFEDVFLCDEPE